jgi:putative NIF3 family GTP cyclohydrolase 1 type 2
MASTAQEIVDQIQQKLGSSWKDSPVDTIVAGKPDLQVTGIATTFAPSMEVLEKAFASQRNMIISRESPFWMRSGAPGGGAGQPPTGLGQGNVRKVPDADPVYKAKLDYISAHNLVVYRLFANWNAHQPDMQLQALAKALGWEKYYKPAGGQPWASYNGFFVPPPATLKETALKIKRTFKMKSIRLGGDPDTVVRKVALFPGLYWLNDVQKLMAEPDVNVLIAGEPKWENEIGPYIFDTADAGQKTGQIMLGEEVSEEPGAGEMATWLKSFITAVPVEHIPTGEPCWMPYQS